MQPAHATQCIACDRSARISRCTSPELPLSLFQSSCGLRCIQLRLGGTDPSRHNGAERKNERNPMSEDRTTTATASMSAADVLSKVPAVTLTFWIIKILATTLGETGGDAVTMSWLGETTAAANPNGYLIGTAIFAAALVLLVIAQIVAKKIPPIPLLDDHHCLDHCWHDAGRLRRPFARRRLHRRFVDIVSLRHGCARALVLVRGNYRG